MVRQALRKSHLFAYGTAIGAVSVIVAACGGSTATATPPPTTAPTATPRPTQGAPTVTAAPAAIPTPRPTSTAASATTPTPRPTSTAVPSTPTPVGPQPKYGGSLVTGSYTSPPATGNFRFYPNPPRGTNASYWIPHNAQNNLIIFDPYQGNKVLQGELAESWQYSGDGMTLTFKTRQGVAWHDGKPFTARDVAYSINLILTPPQDWIANLRAVLAPKIASVNAPDDQTVVFQLRQSSASLIARLTDYTLLIMPSHVDLEAMSRKPIGTGPYLFDSTNINVSSKMVRNPNYFMKDPAGRRLPFIDSQEWFQFSDAQSIVAAFRSGRLDYLNSFQGSAVLPQRRAIAASVPGAQFNEYLRTPEGFVLSNKPPLNDPRVREAMTLWADRKEYVDIGFEGLGCWYDVGMLCEWQGGRWTLPAKDIMSRPGYRYLDKTGALIDSYDKLVAKRSEMVKDPADRQRAKELLAQAGIKPGDVKIAVKVQQSQVRTGGPVFIAQMGELFGATWTTDNEPSSQAFLQDLRSNNFSVYYSGFQAFGVDDPELTLEQVYSASARHYGGFPPDQRFDQLFLAQDRELDPAKRKPIIQDLQRALIDGREQFIFYNGGSATVSAAYVRDWPAANVNFNNTFRLDRMWLDR